MDGREQRGRALAQDKRIKPVEGGLWFVPSETAGGYLVNVETGQCSCPDGQRGSKCKHLWAVEIARGVPIVVGRAALAPAKRLPAVDLTPEEQAQVRAMLRYLRRQHDDDWGALAKVLRFAPKTLLNVVHGHNVTASMAVRVARLVGASVDDLLAGKSLPPDACPFCGRCRSEAAP